MATASSRIRVQARIEYTVPVSGEWGATYVEVQKAYIMLTDELKDLARSQLLGDVPRFADDLIRVLPGEDEIVIFADVFTVTNPPSDELLGLLGEVRRWKRIAKTIR